MGQDDQVHPPPSDFASKSYRDFSLLCVTTFRLLGRDGLAIAEDADLDLDTVDEPFDEHLLVACSKASGDAGSQLGLVVRLRDPEARPAEAGGA